MELFHHNRRISGYDRIRLYAFRYYCAGSNHGVLADGDAFQNHGVHSDPNVVADFDWRGFQRGARWAVFEIWRQGLRVDQALSRFERMKIGIGDADIP